MSESIGNPETRASSWIQFSISVIGFGILIGQLWAFQVRNTSSRWAYGSTLTRRYNPWGASDSTLKFVPWFASKKLSILSIAEVYHSKVVKPNLLSNNLVAQGWISTRDPSWLLLGQIIKVKSRQEVWTSDKQGQLPRIENNIPCIALPADLALLIAMTVRVQTSWVSNRAQGRDKIRPAIWRGLDYEILVDRLPTATLMRIQPVLPLKVGPREDQWENSFRTYANNLPREDSIQGKISHL
jgi:hypothetical protein